MLLFTAIRPAWSRATLISFSIFCSTIEEEEPIRLLKELEPSEKVVIVEHFSLWGGL